MKVLDLPKVAVVVPTYWCSGPGAQKHGPFDHPTPLGAPSTLGRLLESLALQKEVEFILIVVVAGCPPWVVPRAEAEVRRILAPFRKLWPVLQLGRRETISLREWAQRLGAPASALGLADYGQVRNLQLLASLLLGAEVIVALDDDEVLPPGYLKRAMELVGQRVDGAPVLGIAGVYRHADGSYELPSAAPSGNPFLDKASLINSALAQLLSCSERAVETPFAFGGSMVLHWQLARSVPFDPWIGRGEDIDYVLSARLFGFRFWLDKELWVTHLPPVEYRASPCAILRRDVWRFLYQRAKLAAARTRGLIVDLDLDPYPGSLIREDLEAQAVMALRAVCGRRHAEKFVDAACQKAERSCEAYLSLRRQWAALFANPTCWEEGLGFLRGLLRP